MMVVNFLSDSFNLHITQNSIISCPLCPLLLYLPSLLLYLPGFQALQFPNVIYNITFLFP